MEELLKALIDIQQNLNAPKGQYNNFGKFNFALWRILRPRSSLSWLSTHAESVSLTRLRITATELS
jgi:hypothetical protein